MKTIPGGYLFECFIIKQTDGPEIAVFVIDAYLLRDLATVSRLADEDEGYQRIINPRKLAAIKRYVECKGAVLPTGIVLASEKSGFVTVEERRPLDKTGTIWSAKLRVRNKKAYKPFLVIDGQHRLFGITISKLSRYPIPVTLLLDAPKIIQMANFEVINNKATRIPSAHLNELRAVMFDITPHEKEEVDNLLKQLGAKSLSSAALVSELNGSGMVFEEILDYPSNKKNGFVSSTTLVQCVEKSRRDGFLQYLADEGDEHLIAYNALWEGIRTRFKKRWRFEVEVFSEVASGKKNMKEARSAKRLLHSASLSVLGQIADNELASRTFRPKWLEDTSKIVDLVKGDIFGSLSERIWDDHTLKIDNTSKGRHALKAYIDEKIIDVK